MVSVSASASSFGGESSRAAASSRKTNGDDDDGDDSDNDGDDDDHDDDDDDDDEEASMTSSSLTSSGPDTMSSPNCDVIKVGHDDQGILGFAVRISALSEDSCFPLNKVKFYILILDLILLNDVEK